MNKYVIDKGIFEKYNSKIFDEFQNIIAKVTLNIEHNGINLKNVKLLTKNIEQYKLYEI